MSLIPVELGRVPVDTPQKHLPVPEFHQLRTGLLMKGHHTALGIYPQLPDRFPGHCRFHSACFSFHTHMTPSAPLGAFFVPVPIRRFEHRFCCTFFQKISNFLGQQRTHHLIVHHGEALPQVIVGAEPPPRQLRRDLHHPAGSGGVQQQPHPPHVEIVGDDGHCFMVVIRQQRQRILQILSGIGRPLL
mgnify:CR=1 FL=1